MMDSYQNPQVKIAEPPILTFDNFYFVFLSGSPYTMKFLEIMRRVRETNLMHWVP